MLTAQDLSQIKTIVEDVVEQKLEEKLEQKLEQKLDEKLEQKLEKKLAPINKRLRKIQKDLTATINFFDNKDINHEKRIRKIEKHLGFPQAL